MKQVTDKRFSDSRPTGVQIWAIGIYVGESPFVFSPMSSANKPVLTGDSVLDAPASFVADPFMLKVAGTWHMFFEVMNARTGKGEIGLAISQDGVRWRYQQIVLREPFHLSYPYVFEWANEYYMVPESHGARSVRLYKAVEFPTRWSFVQELLTGDDFVDPSVFRFDDRWWLLTDLARPPYFAGVLRLFSAQTLMGPWAEHPKSPVIDGNPHIARPAGRIVLTGNSVIRYAQDCDPVYGSRVRAFEINQLTQTGYREREVCQAPVLSASGASWNASGMHHIDPHLTDGGSWLAAVDGFYWQEPGAEANGGLKLASKTLARVKRHLRARKAYIVASEIKGVLKKHYKRVNDRIEVISLEPARPSRGNVLFSYVTHAFSGQAVPYSHTSYWESRQMAEIFVDLGYSVDVISAVNAGGFFPQKDYAFFVGHRHNFERVAQRLNRDCVKVLHCDVAHWLFHDTAGCSRLLALQQRRGITLPLLRLQGRNMAIEHADCATVLGNEFTLGTYAYAKKPLYRLPISAPALYPWPKGKDFEACRRHFLWFGSNGFVHKGLDLVLEAFAGVPEYHLTVCGPLNDEVEKDFEKAFYKELYQTRNIHTVGWVDLESPEFLQIASSSIGLIYPSCSEGQSGGVVSCLHAALLPIISRESGVDVDDFGFLLRDCSIDVIRDSIQRVAGLPARELEQRARQAWQFSRANHTRETFTEEYRKTAERIISMYNRDAESVRKTSQRELDTTASTQGSHG